MGTVAWTLKLIGIYKSYNSTKIKALRVLMGAVAWTLKLIGIYVEIN